MRSLWSILLTSSLVAACGGGSPPAGGGGGDDTQTTPDAAVIAPGTNGFSVVTPDITIKSSEEITYCYYFHTSNTSDVIVKNWTSTLAPGSHHLILYFQSSNSHPDGYLDPTGNCGGTDSGISNIPIWTYSSSQPTQETDMPADDGTGTPVGMLIPAGQAAVMQLHYINSTDNDMIAHASVNANGYAPGTKYTPAAAYVSYNNDIKIPAGAVELPFTASCTTPAGANFFTMSTHSHKQTYMDTVADSSGVFLTTTDWEHPTIMNWNTPFFQIPGNSFTYSCTYNNDAPGAVEIDSGPSAATNEMCMAVGYYFPATSPQICFQQGGHSYVIND